MGNNIKIQKTVYQKDAFGKVVNSDFSTFTQPTSVPLGKSIDEFFKDYEDLYLEIPINGDQKSHEYLAGRSGELLSIQDALIDIQPLLDEITELRERLLNANEQIFDLERRLEGGNV